MTLKQLPREPIYFVLAFIAIALVGIIVPNVPPPRVVSSQNACVASLGYIQAKKAEWAVRTSSPATAVPTEADLFGTNENAWPSCPAGGKYHIGALNEMRTCSIGPPEHVFK